MPPTDRASAAVSDPVWTLKVNCSGSWANVVRFPLDAAGHTKAQVLTACGLLYYASGGRSKFKVVDESGVVVAEVPMRMGSAP